MKLYFSLIFCLTIFSVFSQTIIKGKLKSSNLYITYDKPLSDFSTKELKEQTVTDEEGKFFISFTQKRPATFNFIFNEYYLMLILVPGDSLQITENNDHTLTILGSNRSGHIYYNNIYDQPKLRKFEGIRTIFSENYKQDENALFALTKKEIFTQTRWIDSLENALKISHSYAESVRYNVIGALAWEASNLIDKYFSYESTGEQKKKNALLKSKLLTLIDLQNTNLWTIKDAILLLDIYYQELYRANPVVDSTEVFLNDIPYYTLIPMPYKKYMWGDAIIGYLGMVPDLFDYCTIFKKYKSLYKNGEFTEYLEKKNLCSAPEQTKENKDIKIKETSQTDFFNMLDFEFHGKRLFIDLWATWCIPCKMEFKYYDKDLYDFFVKYKIEPVYISLDNSKAKSRWQREIKILNLKGNHILANEKLIESIKDIIYDNKELYIPRYIIVDETGKIINDDAKRPSQPSLKEQIMTYFKK